MRHYFFCALLLALLVAAPHDVSAQKGKKAKGSAKMSYTKGSNIQTFTVNGVSFTMVRVEGGSFTMGGTVEQGSDAYDIEKPAHKVTVSSFMIGQTEVTQELWQAVMGTNPSRFKGAKRPVEQVSWDDCQKFLRKLNAKTGKNFRMPTEAEWEYAARGGSKRHGYKYSGGNTVDKVAWYCDNSGDETHPVGTKRANELGIYDMSGNVWEWCQDKWHPYDGSTSTGSNRVYRGGCQGTAVCRIGATMRPTTAAATLVSGLPYSLLCNSFEDTRGNSIHLSSSSWLAYALCGLWL